MPGHPKIRTAATRSTGVLALLLGAVVAIPAEAGAAPNGHGSAAQNCRAAVSFDRHDFPRHPKINNRFLQLLPGTNTVLSGTVRDENGQLHSHQILTTASGVTKVLDGVRTVVVFERDIQDGTLQESELAFLAQDKQGTVWNIGEYPEAYEDGKLVGADTWISGVARAKAASVAALLPCCTVWEILSGFSSHTRGASLLAASAVDVTDGKGS